MELPLVSIIIPVYNSEKFLKGCVETVLQQDYENFELLLVDDGSRDSSAELCDGFSLKDPRIRVFHQENQGLSGARNTGLSNASGKYVLFIDADDFIRPGLLSAVISRMENSSSQLCVYGYDIVRSFSPAEPVIPSDYSGPADPGVLYELVDKNLFGFACNKIFLKEFLDKHSLRFSTDIKFMEDRPFIMELWKYVSKVDCIERSFYGYVQHEGSLMANHSGSISADPFRYIYFYDDSLKPLLDFMAESGIEDNRISEYSFKYTASLCGSLLKQLCLTDRSYKKELTDLFQSSILYFCFERGYEKYASGNRFEKLLHFYNKGSKIRRSAISFCVRAVLNLKKLRAGK